MIAAGICRRSRSGRGRVTGSSSRGSSGRTFTGGWSRSGWFVDHHHGHTDGGQAQAGIKLR
ncbi:MAG: hypothetical protein ACK559_26285 [bacterium]